MIRSELQKIKTMLSAVFSSSFKKTPRGESMGELPLIIGFVVMGSIFAFIMVNDLSTTPNGLQTPRMDPVTVILSSVPEATWPILLAFIGIVASVIVVLMGVSTERNENR